MIMINNFNGRFCPSTTNYPLQPIEITTNYPDHGTIALLSGLGQPIEITTNYPDHHTIALLSELGSY